MRKALQSILILSGFCRFAAADGPPSFAITTEAAPARVGQKSVAKIKLSPGAGYHINRDYPTAMTLKDVPAGVLVDKPLQGKKDAVRFEETGAEFDVTVTADAAGKKVLAGELKFAVCSDKTCDPKKEKLSIPIEVR